MIVEKGRPYLTYPIYTNGQDFALSFGSILKFQLDARMLATKILYNIKTMYSLDVDLNQDIWRNMEVWPRFTSPGKVLA
jgi:hypothetical protein